MQNFQVTRSALQHYSRILDNMIHLSLLSVYNFIRRGLVRGLADKPPSPSPSPSPSPWLSRPRPSPAKVDLSPDFSPRPDLSTTSLTGLQKATVSVTISVSSMSSLPLFSCYLVLVLLTK